MYVEVFKPKGGENLKIYTKNSKTWKTCVAAMANVVDEVGLKLTPEGVKAKAMDASHVSLVDLDLPANAFDEYDVKTATVLGVNLAELGRVMSRAKPDDELTIELDEQTNRLALAFKGASSRKFELPLIDIAETELPEPKLQFTASATISAGQLQDALKDAELAGETVRLGLGTEGFAVTTEGDARSAEFALEKGSEGMVAHDVKQPAKAMYARANLSNIVKAAAPADTVTIQLGNNLPVQLDYPVADGKGRLRFLLAPRIETE